MLSRCHAGPTPAKMRFSCDSPLEGAVRSEPVSEGENSLLARKIQGNTSILAIHPPNSVESRMWINALQFKFPTQWNRELIRLQQRIKSAHQGSFLREQGRLS